MAMEFGPPGGIRGERIKVQNYPATAATASGPGDGGAPTLPVEGGFTPDGIVSHLKSLVTIYDKLSFLLSIMYSITPFDDFHPDIIRYEQMLKDLDLMRAINHRDALVAEFPVEYFGKDYGPDDPFIYREETEKIIAEINLDIVEVTGRIIRKLSENILDLSNI